MALPETTNLFSALVSGASVLGIGFGGTVMDEVLPSDNSMNGIDRAVRAALAVDMVMFDELTRMVELSRTVDRT
jgi:hypothetical protein